MILIKNEITAFWVAMLIIWGGVAVGIVVFWVLLTS